MVTDYDCWHDDHEHVTVEAVIKVMHQNADNARRLIMAVAPKLGPERQPCPLGVGNHAGHGGDHRAGQARSRSLAAKLDAVAGRILKKGLKPNGFHSDTHPHHSRLSQAGHHVPRHHHLAGQSARLPPRGGRAGAALCRHPQSTRWRGWKRAASSWAARWRISSPCGFVPIRKKGKLPYTVIGEDLRPGIWQGPGRDPYRCLRKGRACACWSTI